MGGTRELIYLFIILAAMLVGVRASSRRMRSWAKYLSIFVALLGVSAWIYDRYLWSEGKPLIEDQLTCLLRPKAPSCAKATSSAALKPAPAPALPMTPLQEAAQRLAASLRARGTLPGQPEPPPPSRVDKEIVSTGDQATTVWTSSYYSNDDFDHLAPPGGAVDARLRIGGWGDTYLALMKFKLPARPRHVRSAILELHLFNEDAPDSKPVEMILGRIASTWEGHVGDHFRFLDMPRIQPLAVLPAPDRGLPVYRIDLTRLYNEWVANPDANEGFSLVPAELPSNEARNQYFNSFHSMEAAEWEKRPRLLLTY
ncbi:MAG TPA: DNRLRE domain-containing protein [Allosphingosinicella sp.]|nr:DNRLRE domain-containing protein [Allosphingosinicella sp.]